MVIAGAVPPPSLLRRRHVAGCLYVATGHYRTAVGRLRQPADREAGAQLQPTRTSGARRRAGRAGGQPRRAAAGRMWNNVTSGAHARRHGRADNAAPVGKPAARISGSVFSRRGESPRADAVEQRAVTVEFEHRAPPRALPFPSLFPLSSLSHYYSCSLTPLLLSYPPHPVLPLLFSSCHISLPSSTR